MESLNRPYMIEKQLKVISEDNQNSFPIIGKWGPVIPFFGQKGFIGKMV